MNDDLQEVDIPERLGRYRLDKDLGVGASAYVFLGHDEELQRPVAVKVIRPELIDAPRVQAEFLGEARILAQLDHVAIVPIYDFGQTDGGLYYLVCKFMEGGDLRSRLEQGHLECREAVVLVATVAEALHYAHQHGLVHRDVKPANILFDRDRRPAVADFGLALRSEEVGTGPLRLGTCAYMSPEQARGEADRADARSDVFSLGIVLYELLSGRRPFEGASRDEILQQVRNHEPVPPSRWNSAIHAELERICRKALAKDRAGRYATAKALAEDLHRWHSETPVATPPPCLAPRVVHPFGAADALAYLELLPGPRNQDGLPPSIAFWKAALECTDPRKAFPVGVLYGTSGSGKTSLMQAGVLPRLAGVATVMIETAPGETEPILRDAILRDPALSSCAGTLPELLKILRDQPGDRKRVLVIDRFELWLHTWSGSSAEPMIEALRHCDGVHLQTLLVIRDDFRPAIKRLMNVLEFPLVESHNCAPVELFDLQHAREVLAVFGRALGRLPREPAALTEAQAQFLDESVTCMLRHGKVLPLQLSAFAYRVQEENWEPATLREHGPLSMGVLPPYLKKQVELALARHPRPSHRQAAHAVLSALLPRSGDLLDHTCSSAELQERSGYREQPEAFIELMRILCRELRLVVPAGAPADGMATPGERRYQLAYEYLVPFLRHWLTRQPHTTS